MAKLNPYLSFDNNCREAMNFYKDCLSGDLNIQTVGEMPAMAAQMPPEMKDKVLHSVLTSGDIVIMASDLCREKRVQGNAHQLCINCDTDEEFTSFFTKLSAGGSVVEDIKEMPWGAKFGALLDKYGNNWIFNFQLTK